jgi:uncharacterized membrane protein
MGFSVDKVSFLRMRRRSPDIPIFKEKQLLRPSSRYPHDPISSSRLLAFSDGVFAIAITLLVFNLKVPEIPEGDVHRLLPAAIKAMLPRFFTYLISFLLIAVFWTIHHRMLDLVAHVDYTFIWINVLYLLAISFSPFPSALMGTYHDESFSLVFYICCMFIVVSLSLLMWRYASRHHRLLSKDTPSSAISYFFIRGTATLIILVIALPIAIYNARWGQVCLLLIFPVQWVLRAYHKRFIAGSGESR